MAMSTLHVRVRAVIAGAAFHDAKDPEALADAGRILAALIRRKVVFVEPGSARLSGADRTDLYERVIRAYHDGCRRRVHLGDPDDIRGGGSAHALEQCDPEGQRQTRADSEELFTAVAPYLAHRRTA